MIGRLERVAPRIGSGGGVTAIACDVVVIGSGLGALVAATYAARSGLRVVLVEEEGQEKRPPILREPFLVASGDPTDPIELMMKELGLSPVERRYLRSSAPAVQVVLAEARVDLGGGREACAAELDIHGLAPRAAARSWLKAVESLGDAARLSLRQDRWSPLLTRLSLRLLKGAGTPLAVSTVAQAICPPAPPGIGALVGPVTEVLSRSAGPDAERAPALLLRAVLNESTRGPDAAAGLLDVLRKRFGVSYGETRSASAVSFLGGRLRAGVDLGRERLTARALVLGAPARLLATGNPEPQLPRWLRNPPDVAAVSVRLLRAESAALPSGMSSHLIDASDPKTTRWLLRSPDPVDERVEWLVVRSWPLPPEEKTGPLGGLAPFAGDRIAEGDPGPRPRWDLGGDEVRVRGPGWPVVRSRSPLVLSVGPDVAPLLGAEGEMWIGRQVGRSLGRLFGPRRRRR